MFQGLVFIGYISSHQRAGSSQHLGPVSSVDKMPALLSRPALSTKQCIKSMLQTIEHNACSSPWRLS